jgi:hypothetical protein
MRRTTYSLTTVIAVVFLAVAAIACGGSSSGSTGSSSPQASAGPSVSAQALLLQSLAATATIKSAALTADLAIKPQGDTSKMDATTQAMVGQGITVHIAGKASSAAVDATMDVGFAGQKLPFAIKTQGKKGWIQYQGKWYVLDQKTAGSLITPGASPSSQLGGLGLDPTKWGATFKLVGTEDVGGTPAYHVTATADPKKMAAALMKAMNDPAVAKQLGQDSKQLEKQLKTNQQQLQQLQQGLKSATADFWIGTSDKRLRKMTVVVAMDTSGMTSTSTVQGLGAITMTGGITLSGFDQKVTVTPPAGALPFDQLTNSLLGGLIGGMGSTSGSSF